MRKLKKLIKDLEKIRGRHTELVSVYVPSGYNITDISTQLFQEKSTASNIKSKSTRKNVLTALERIIQHLKLFKETPENGLVVFCGNVSPVEGKEDIKLWSFEPPVKMNQKLYWCDQIFVLDPLKELIRERELYGLIVLDAKEATIGLLIGKSIQVVKHIQSTVPSKTVKGGMSQKRYDGIREDALNEFMKKVAEVADKSFLEQKDLKGVLVGGPGPLKEDFVRGEYLHFELGKKVIGIKNVSYTDEYGLQELVNRSEDVLQQAAVVKERTLLEKFFAELQKGGNVTYGFHETIRALEQGAVGTLLLSENFDWVHAKLKCSCGFQTEKDLPRERLARETCEKCNKFMEVVEEKEFSEIISQKAKSLGSNVEYISTDTREGVQFKELGGIGAFLRYKIS